MALDLVLSLNPTFSIISISFLISLVTVVVYKYATNQQLMKQLKQEQEELKKEMKTLKDTPEKMAEVQQKFTATNMKYMMQSMKPTFITLLPLLLIFGWLGNHYAYEPVLPGQEFSITLLVEGYKGKIKAETPEGLTATGANEKEVENGEAIFTFKGEKGEYLVTFTADGKEYGKEVVVSSARKFAAAEKKFEGPVKAAKINYKNLEVLNLGFTTFGWLGTYILASIVFSIVLRKVFRVY